MHRRSPLLRVAHALVGVLAVWSMAYRAFSGPMSSTGECASTAGMHAMHMAATMPPGGAEARSCPVSTPADACCTMCCEAVTLAGVSTAGAARMVAGTPVFAVTIPASVTLTPKPPPPERTA
jgi:hypothetical protein